MATCPILIFSTLLEYFFYFCYSNIQNLILQYWEGNFLDTIFTRKSVRSFENREVEPEKLEQIMKAAMQAPTAKNQQAWEFYVITNKEILQQLGKATPYSMPAAHAAAAVVVCYNKEKLTVPEMADIDCAIATENIWLECEALGLGGVMIGVAPFQDRIEKLGEILNLPENLSAFTIFAFGYPKQKQPQKSRYDENKIHYVK
jgi:nitroreductase